MPEVAARGQFLDVPLPGKEGGLARIDIHFAFQAKGGIVAFQIEIIAIAFPYGGDHRRAAVYLHLPAIRQMAWLPIERIQDDESGLGGTRQGCQSQDRQQYENAPQRPSVSSLLSHDMVRFCWGLAEGGAVGDPTFSPPHLRLPYYSHFFASRGSFIGVTA